MLILCSLYINAFSMKNSNDSYLLTSRFSKPGLFSVFNTVIGCLHEYEQKKWKGLRVDFGDKGAYYDINYGLNWWEYYFEPINLGLVDNIKLKRFSEYKKIIFSLRAQFKLPKSTAFKLIGRYVTLKEHVKKKVDEVFNKYFKNYYVIGVHYRGTDKIIEAPKVTYEDTLREIQDAIENAPQNKTRIFIATDDAVFFEFIKEKFPDKAFGIDAIRSSNGKPVHHFEKIQNYKKGEDAVIDCVLLSKCQLLIKTASNLSDCSIQFNPNIKVIHLNKSYNKSLTGIVANRIKYAIFSTLNSIFIAPFYNYWKYKFRPSSCK